EGGFFGGAAVDRLVDLGGLLSSVLRVTPSQERGRGSDHRHQDRHDQHFGRLDQHFGRLVKSEDHGSESPLHSGGGAAIVASDSTIASVPRCWSLGSLPGALPAPTQE